MNLPFKKSLFLELLRYPVFVDFVKSASSLDVPEEIESAEFVAKRLKPYRLYLQNNIDTVNSLTTTFLENNPSFWAIVFTINKMAVEFTLGQSGLEKRKQTRESFINKKLDMVYDTLMNAKLPGFDPAQLKNRINSTDFHVYGSYEFKQHLLDKITDNQEETIKNLYLYAMSMLDRFFVKSKDIVMGKFNRLMQYEDMLKNYFDRVVIINLDRREDRWKAIKDKLSKINWPFKEPERFSAYDGNYLPTPVGWKDGPGTWGCLLSHREVLARAIQDGLQNVLVLEDDIFFAPNFETRVLEFLKGIPENWDQIMLGGQYFDDTKVYDISPEIRKVSLCHRAHAYAVKGNFMRYMYSKLCSAYGHVDHILNTFQDRYNVYTPRHFLIGQDGSPSDISGKQASPDLLRNPPDKDTPVFVLAPDIELHKQVVASDLPLHFGTVSDAGVTREIENLATKPSSNLPFALHNFMLSSIWFARSVYPSKYSTILNPAGLLLEQILQAKGNINLIYIETLEQLKEAITKYPFGEELPSQFPESEKQI
jgi:glycosyl transferase family 25